MNAERRKELGEAVALLAQARVLIEQAGEDEAEAFDALPESLQDGERGQRMTDVAEALDDIACEIDDLEGRLGELAE